MRFVEAPYLGQSSPPDNALAKTLKETEEKLKASEKENERLSLRIKSLMEERHEEAGKMMEFNSNYRLLSRLDYLRDDHESLKKIVADSNEKLENKLAHYKSKASSQEKKINKNKESALSLTDGLYEISASTTATVEELQEDVAVLTKWMNEVKVNEVKKVKHELQAQQAKHELQAKQAQAERGFWGEVYVSPRSQCVEAVWEEGPGISPRDQRGTWGDSTCDRRDEAYEGWSPAISPRDPRGAWGETRADQW